MIVNLKGTKFAGVIDDLACRWGQTMPEALYTDILTNKMLLELEDSMLAKLEHNAISKHHLLWGNMTKSRQQEIPIPILGLGYTLTFYFPTSPIELGNITSVQLPMAGLTGFTLQELLI